MKNSGDSRLSNRPSFPEALAVVAFLTLIIAAFASWIFRQGYILYWGDAQAHLNISRSLVDSRQPGIDQLGTVWLPALHLLALPFAINDQLWQTGLAGTIPVALCFVVAGTCFFLAARELYSSLASAMVVLLCFAFNPNVLYLSSIPMTETVFLAGLSMLLLALIRFRRTGSNGYFFLGIGAGWLMSLTRYDGWFLIPFECFLFARWAPKKRISTFVLFGALASLVPVAWMANSWWQTGNALDFFNGPYSASAIQAGKPYPGWHNWRQAAQYYFAAGKLCAGWPLVFIGTLGALAAILNKRRRAGLFLLLTPAFYVWSMHSSANPIFVPVLWPFSWYNTRYGIAVVAVCAFAAGALIDAFPFGKRIAAFIVIIVATWPWLMHPSPQQWVCWKESERNSLARRVWTRAAADYMSAYYRAGDGVLAGFGDLTGIFCRMALPLSEITHEGTRPEWLIETTATGAAHPMKWAIAQHGDYLWRALQKSQPPAYAPVYIIKTKDAPDLEIYHRIHD